MYQYCSFLSFVSSDATAKVAAADTWRWLVAAGPFTEPGWQLVGLSSAGSMLESAYPFFHKFKLFVA